MRPSNERKLLEGIIRASRKPPAIRTLRMTVIGTSVWAVAILVILTIFGGRAGLTWQMVAAVGVGFALGVFTYYDWYRNAASVSWPVVSPYLDLAAIERRISELRT